jgi:acyl carrier protein
MSPPPVTLDMALAAVRRLLARRDVDASELAAATRIDDLGLDSTDVVDLFADLEERCGRALDPDSALDAETIGDLSRLSARRA